MAQENASTAELPTEKPSDVEKASSESDVEQHGYLTGIGLHLTTVGVVLSLLIVNLEVTIVSTSLVAITNELQGFSKTSWIVSGYLITYMGFMILWSKLSDIFGRKHCIIASLAIFTAFSGGCGGVQSLSQLIICRTFQGIGAAGAYAMAALITYEMVPKEKLPLYGGLNSVAVALATLMGPLFGGAINNHTTWRWVFYLNLPIGAFVIAVLYLGVPREFPYQRRQNYRTVSSKSLARLDILGGVLLLAGSLLLSTVLLETPIKFAWSASGTIALLALTGVSWVFFFVWEWFISRHDGTQEPLFPWDFVHNRAWMGMLISTFLAGLPFNVVVVFLPQRLQAVSGDSPMGAGVRLLPYTFGAAFGAALANALGGKRRFAVMHILFAGATLQIIGLALLSTMPDNSEFPNKGFGFETVAGVGMGISYGILVLATPFVADPKHLAVATGAIIQFRFFGGVVGLALATTLMNNHIKSKLGDTLPNGDFSQILDSAKLLSLLPPDVKARVIQVFAQSYNLQTKAMIAFAAAQLPAALLLWKKEQIRVG